jgi:hypothetical protein
MCPYYLDGDLAVPDPKVEGGPVIPVCQPRLSSRLAVASVQFSRTVERLSRAGRQRSSCERALRPHIAGGGRRSLKTQQHALRWLFVLLRATDAE